MKIDAFCHIMPRPYYDRFFRLDETVHAANLRKRVANIPCLVDMDVRFAQMDEFGDRAHRQGVITRARGVPLRAGPFIE